MRRFRDQVGAVLGRVSHAVIEVSVFIDLVHSYFDFIDFSVSFIKRV
jgi:hypothetical protein